MSGGSGRTRPGGPTTARLVLVGSVLVVALLGWWLTAGRSSGSPGPSVAVAASSSSSGSAGGAVAARPSGSSGSSQVSVGAQGSLRAKALAVLRVVDQTGRPPKGYVGGRQFMNDGRGGTSALPRRDSHGAAILYHEYDVNPYTSGVNRGPQRLVIGGDGSAWYTGDHYVTWVRLR